MVKIAALKCLYNEHIQSEMLKYCKNVFHMKYTINSKVLVQTAVNEITKACFL